MNLLLIYCLSLTMLVTSVTGAFARGQMAFGQSLQICAEGEAAVITVDAHGNPVAPTHLCPDCLSVAVGLPPAAFEFARPSAGWLRFAVPLRAWFATPIAAHALARGPPVLI